MLHELRKLNGEALLQNGAKMDTLIDVQRRCVCPPNLQKWWAMRPLQKKLVVEQDAAKRSAIEKLSEKLRTTCAAIDAKKAGAPEFASWKASLSDTSELDVVYAAASHIKKGELAVALMNGPGFWHIPSLSPLRAMN